MVLPEPSRYRYSLCSTTSLLKSLSVTTTSNGPDYNDTLDEFVATLTLLNVEALEFADEQSFQNGFLPFSNSCAL